MRLCTRNLPTHALVSLDAALNALVVGDRIGAYKICKAIVARSANVRASRVLAHIAARHDRRDWAKVWLEASLPGEERSRDRVQALAQAYLSVGRFDIALAISEEALQVDPGVVTLEIVRGQCFLALKRLDEANACFGRAAEARPEMVEASVGLAEALSVVGRQKSALAVLDAAVEHAPDSSKARISRAIALEALGRINEAKTDYRAVLRLDRDSVVARGNLGMIYLAINHPDEAISLFREIILRNPDNAVAFNNLGLAIERKGDLRGAEVCFKRAVRLDRSLASGHNNLARMLQRRCGVLALRHYAIAERFDPRLAAVANNRANLLMTRLRLREAFAEFRRAFALNPDYRDAYSNYLFALNYSPDVDEAFLSAAHRSCPFLQPANPGRLALVGRRARPRLRLGMVSGDFAHHPIGYFTYPFLEAMKDQDNSLVVLYSNRQNEDDLTGQFKAVCHTWRPVSTLSDEVLATQMRQDDLDILIDLSGHTQGNRLGCLPFGPAKVLMHWGYVHSIPNVDYSIWDRFQVPDAATEAMFGEAILHLPDARWCYRAPEYAPAVAPPPSSSQPAVTFGSFNNICKLNEHVLDLWSQILRESPGSILVLSWKTLVDRSERERLKSAFASRGIDPRRIRPRAGADSHAGVLGEYGEIDIALDPFPFSGCLTTMEALWMGVPVVTLPQARPSSRQSFSFLNVLGRTNWIARDVHDYVRIACTLAHDRGMLRSFRAHQRHAMARSPLCDGRRFAAAFRSIIGSCL